MDKGPPSPIQSDGKIIVVAGRRRLPDFAVARYNTDGTLDASFGTGGRVTIDFGGTMTSPLAWRSTRGPDSRRRPLTAGRLDRHRLRRGPADRRGALDASFGTGGKATIDFGDTHDDGMAWRSTRRAGSSSPAIHSRAGSTDTDFAVARLTAAGALDASFGTGGKATIDFGGTDDLARDVAIDGRAGSSSPALTLGRLNRWDFAVVRLTAAGTLDASFGAGGKATVDFGGLPDGARRGGRRSGPDRRRRLHNEPGPAR